MKPNYNILKEIKFNSILPHDSPFIFTEGENQLLDENTNVHNML